MKEKKFLSYLNKYHSWLKEHKTKAEEEFAERGSHAKDMKKWAK